VRRRSPISTACSSCSSRTIFRSRRYDPLVEQLGGKPTPACGWALGVERIIELLKESKLAPEPEGCDVYVVHQGEKARVQALISAERMRDAGFDVVFHCSPDGATSSFKSQMKRADASGAAYAVIIGDREVEAGVVGVKPLRGMAGTKGQGSDADKQAENQAEQQPEQQAEVPVEQLTEFLIDAMVATVDDGE
jgi:histidyl-tRNA synthetase